MAEVVVGDSAYIVMVEGIPHPVDKVTKACSCGGACNAPQLLEQYFSSGIGHHCPICEAKTTPHPTSKQIWVCPTDKTHYWKVRMELNRERWKLAKMRNDLYKKIRRLGLAPTTEQGQDGAAEGTVLPSEMRPMPEASQSAP